MSTRVVIATLWTGPYLVRDTASCTPPAELDVIAGELAMSENCGTPVVVRELEVLELPRYRVEDPGPTREQRQARRHPPTRPGIGPARPGLPAARSHDVRA